MPSKLLPGKADTPAFDRLGLFSDLGYLPVGKLLPGNQAILRESAYKKAQFLGSIPKTKCGTSDGYFGKFVRILDADKYVDPLAVKRRFRIGEKQRNLGGPFYGMQSIKKMGGYGTLFGTFIAPKDYKAFDPRPQPKGRREVERRGIFTNPPKKGTGYGYPDVGIDKYPTHSEEPADHEKRLRQAERAKRKQAMVSQNAFLVASSMRDNFGPNPYLPDKYEGMATYRHTKLPTKDFKPWVPSNPGKKPGNCKDGCLSKFPVWKDDPYLILDRTGVPVVSKRRRKGEEVKPFYPQPWTKTTRTRSLIAKNVTRRVNATNYHSAVVGIYAPGIPKIGDDYEL